MNSTMDEIMRQNDDSLHEYAGLQENLEMANLAIVAVLGTISFALLVGTLFIRLGTNLNTKALPVWGATALFSSFFMFSLFMSLIRGPLIMSGGIWELMWAGPAIIVFFQSAGICAFFYFFHRLFDVSLRYGTDGRQPSSRKLEFFHYFILGILVAVSIAHWATMINYITALDSPPAIIREYHSHTAYSRSRTYVNLELALNVLRWVASAEVMFSFVPVVKNMLRKRKNFRVSSIFIFTGAVFFFARNMMFAIYDARHHSTRESIIVAPVDTVSIIEIVFYIISYVGIIPFLLRWGLVFRDQTEEQDAEHLAQPSMTDSGNTAFIPQVDPQAFKYGPVVAEADATTPVMEMDGSGTMVVEADAATPVTEMDASEQPQRQQKYLYNAREVPSTQPPQSTTPDRS